MTEEEEGGRGGREEDPEVDRRVQIRLRKQRRQHDEEVETLQVREGGR